MARKRKRDSKRGDGYQRGFQDSDLQWLADNFQEQSGRDPELTLEAFAVGYGIQPDLIRGFLAAEQGANQAVEAMLARKSRKKGKWLPVRARRRELAWKSRTQKHLASRFSDWVAYTSSDFGWLAKEFQRQTESHPDLTLEAFASGHGLAPECISRFIRESRRPIALWHGTTDDRARAIMERGFIPPNSARRVWFAKTPELPCRIATRRAEKRRRMPVVISCAVDLEKYPPAERDTHVCVFASPIGSEVIRSISIAKRDGFARHVKDISDAPVAKLTGTSRKQDVLDWINRYLEMGREAAISEHHPAVGVVLQWLEARYEDGRQDAVPDDEMFSLVTMIRSLPGMGMGEVKSVSLEADNDEDKLVDVVITKTSGRVGVHWWLEQYLELVGEVPVDEAHPAVDAIHLWVEAEYATGRDEPISDDEMLVQIVTHLKWKTEGIST